MIRRGQNILRAVPITDALVALVKQRIVRYVVLINIRLDLRKRPVGKRVDFDESGIVHFHDVQIAAFPTL